VDRANLYRLIVLAELAVTRDCEIHVVDQVFNQTFESSASELTVFIE
jgi:hypothetical protein